jgi:hypothetical protein
MRQTKIKYKNLAFSTGFTLVCLMLSIICFKNITLVYGIDKLGIPLFRLIMFISIGLFVGQIIESLGWTKYPAVIANSFCTAAW